MDADQELDCTGLSCPMPVLKLAKTLKKMESGKILHMIATDPGSQKDVPEWIERNKHELLNKEVIDGKYHYHVKRN